jgi:indole-3-glycerol phosphate synthase/phosphoribosylanthranilate isomerase
MTILEQIVKRRKKRIKRLGYAMGLRIPHRRLQPVREFAVSPLLICEIKRASPSKGAIFSGADAADMAASYSKRGVRSVSVLTEEEYFSGSLEDLLRVKKRFPDMAVLRKDFLVDEEDIAISYRAGADAVLLIAAMHDAGTLVRLYRRAKRYGMEALVEVHDKEDLAKAALLGPTLSGFNSRDLRTFAVDPFRPVVLASGVNWKTTPVFESGIRCAEDARYALSSGFHGLLTGESVMRDPDLIGELLKMFSSQAGTVRGRTDFWKRVGERMKRPHPLVKICGLTNEHDARLAHENGADLLGFVFTDSLRRAEAGLLRKLRDLDSIKVGVVVKKDGEPDIDPEVKELLETGLIDAVQFHGNERPEECAGLAFPYYKAVRVGEKATADAVSRYRSPRVLIDAFVPGMRGGTGKRIPSAAIHRIKESHPIWLAGGIGPENVRSIVEEFQPELLDASSGLEEEAGVKSFAKIKKFFEELEVG